MHNFISMKISFLIGLTRDIHNGSEKADILFRFEVLSPSIDKNITYTVLIEFERLNTSVNYEVMTTTEEMISGLDIKLDYNIHYNITVMATNCQGLKFYDEFTIGI